MVVNIVDINLSSCIIGLEFGAWVAACRPDPARSIGQREGLCRLPLSASRQKGVVGGKEERAAFSSPASPLAPPTAGTCCRRADTQFQHMQSTLRPDAVLIHVVFWSICDKSDNNR